MPKSALKPVQESGEKACFESFYIAHLLDSKGYKDRWYDALGMDENYHSYTFTAPKFDGPLYFTVETYF